MSPVLVHETWHGDEIIARSKRANGRAIIGMGERAAVEMTLVAHEISGDLKRSIHVARVDTMGEIPADEVTARVGTAEWTVEVGSWLPYACVENNRGGTHRFADIGWQLAEPTFDEIIMTAWAEEDLR